MPSTLYHCAISGCSHKVLLNNLLDLLVPLLLDFLLFSVFVSFVLRAREKRANQALENLAVRRLIMLVDRLLCSVLPSSVGEISPRKLTVGELEASIAYGGLKPPYAYTTIAPLLSKSIVERKLKLGVVVDRARAEMSEIALRHSAHLDRKILQQLVDLESKLDDSGIALQPDLQILDIEAASKVVADTMQQAGKLHESLLLEVP